MTNWKKILSWESKLHVAPESLADGIADDLRSRGCKIESIETVDSTWIDMPGMIHSDRPFETYDLSDLALEIPSEDVASFILALGELKQRSTAASHPYYKLHGFMSCIVMTPDHYKELAILLKNGLIEAERRAAVFWADKKSPALILREAAAKANNIPLEHVPDLGGHRVDRFFKPHGKS